MGGARGVLPLARARSDAEGMCLFRELSLFEWTAFEFAPQHFCRASEQLAVESTAYLDTLAAQGPRVCAPPWLMPDQARCEEVLSNLDAGRVGPIRLPLLLLLLLLLLLRLPPFGNSLLEDTGAHP